MLAMQVSDEAARRGWQRERKARQRRERREREHHEALSDTPMTEEEFRQHLEAAVREGKVPAMRLWWEYYGRPDSSPSPFDEFDRQHTRPLDRVFPAG
jgi:hypothetical protein